MKKIYALFFITTFLVSSSQVSQWAGHSASERTGNMVVINNKCFVIKTVENPNNCCSQTPYIECYQNGVLLFQKRISTYNIFDAMNLRATANGFLLCHGYQNISGCDVTGVADWIFKIDTTGATVMQFSTGINGDLVMQGSYIDLAPHPDNTFYVTDGVYVYHYSSTGQLLPAVTATFSGIKAIHCTSSGKILINEMNSNGIKNYLFSSTFSLITQSQGAFFVKKFQELSNGNIAGLAPGGGIQLLNQSLNQLAFANGYFTDFHINNDSIFAVGLTSASAIYQVMNSSLQTVHSTTFHIPQFNFTGIGRDKNRKTNIYGWGYSMTPAWGREDGFTSFFTTTTTGTLSSKPDIGVFDIQPNYIRLYGPDSWPGFGWTQLTATVKNFGTDTVRKFQVNYYFSAWTFVSPCSFNLNQVYSMKIAPGGTVTVQTDTFRLSPIFQKPSVIDGKLRVQVCLYTTVPDDLIDINFTNDYACDTLVAYPAGLTDNTHSGVTVYPNPVDRECVIESTLPGQVSLLSISGNEILSDALKPGSNTFHCEGFAPGIYFLRIKYGHDMEVRKMIINR